MSDKNNGQEGRVVQFYFEIARYLLMVIPSMAGSLILVSYLADARSSSGDCGLTKSTLGFLGTASKWYGIVLATTVFAIPRVLGRR